MHRPHYSLMLGVVVVQQYGRTNACCPINYIAYNNKPGFVPCGVINFTFLMNFSNISQNVNVLHISHCLYDILWSSVGE